MFTPPLEGSRPPLGKILDPPLLATSFLPPATKLVQGYVFTGMCDSVQEGVCLSACWDTPPGSRHPLEQTPPGADIPQSRHTPRRTCAGGTHPTEMQPCPYFQTVCWGLASVLGVRAMSQGSIVLLTLAFAMQIVFLLIAQYTVLSHINPGVGNWVEITGMDLTLLAMIALSSVQSSTRTLIHNAILFIDTSNNA